MMIGHGREGKSCECAVSGFRASSVRMTPLTAAGVTSSSLTLLASSGIWTSAPRVLGALDGTLQIAQATLLRCGSRGEGCYKLAAMSTAMASTAMAPMAVSATAPLPEAKVTSS